jgi:hypothetical protein
VLGCSHGQQQACVAGACDQPQEQRVLLLLLLLLAQPSAAAVILTLQHCWMTLKLWVMLLQQ